MSLYDHPDSPSIRYYDLYSRFPEGDVEFFVEEAQRAGSPVLELACGTARLTIPIAEAGVDVTGVDLSEGMLSAAERKVAALPTDVQARIKLHHTDMRDFSLAQRFNLIFIGFNTFLILPDAETQRQTLRNIHHHLADGGRLIISIFDPSIPTIADHLGQNAGKVKRLTSFADPETGDTIVVWESRKYDVSAQTVDQWFIYEAHDETGNMLWRNTQSFTLRYNFRYEMEYLLELCGFEVEALYGDHDRASYGDTGRQIWVVRKAP